jgi:AraC-like DNA-binding protein
VHPTAFPRLDRLSALLEGLAPAMSVTALWTQTRLEPAPKPPNGPGLSIYLSMDKPLRLEWAGQHLSALAPAAGVIRWGLAHRVVDAEGQVPAHLIAIQCRLTGPVAPLFLGEFAAPCLLTSSSDEPALRSAMKLITAELSAPRCGQPALLHRAADSLFVGLLRHLVANPGGRPAGLFMGLADSRIAKALVAMHQSPGHDWTLEHLAAEAGMSRTAFATIFRDLMDKTPGKYLSALRLALAERAVSSGKGLKEAARVVGYRNASALSRALTRSRGLSQSST